MGRGSKYWRWWVIANGGELPKKRQVLSTKVFCDRVFRVRIGDVEKRADGARSYNSRSIQRLKNSLKDCGHDLIIHCPFVACLFIFILPIFLSFHPPISKSTYQGRHSTNRACTRPCRQWMQQVSVKPGRNRAAYPSKHERRDGFLCSSRQGAIPDSNSGQWG